MRIPSLRLVSATARPTGVSFDLGFAANSAGGPVWMATLEVVSAVSAVLVQTVPEFWKICRGYKDGKYRRVSRLPVYALTRE